MARTNQELFARDAHHYFQTDLTPPERVLLEEIGANWGATAMLDLGVGAGRTAFTFGAICRRYVGIDYVPRMIELSRTRVGETERRRFEVGDARDLSRFRGGEFDVAAVHARGWALLVADAHSYEMKIYFVTPAEQLRQLSGAGFITDAILDEQGSVITYPAASRDNWLHFLCHSDAAAPRFG